MRSPDEIRALPELHDIQTSIDGGSAVIHMGQLRGTVIWSTGGEWDHVSVAPFKSWYVPSWKEMCRLKDMFFRPDEWAVQYHPAKSDYVNLKENCLHLWLPRTVLLPRPPIWMV